MGGHFWLGGPPSCLNIEIRYMRKKIEVKWIYQKKKIYKLSPNENVSLSFSAILTLRLVGWLGFTACQPIGLFYAKYVFIYELTYWL